MPFLDTFMATNVSYFFTIVNYFIEFGILITLHVITFLLMRVVDDINWFTDMLESFRLVFSIMNNA